MHRGQANESPVLDASAVTGSHRARRASGVFGRETRISRWLIAVQGTVTSAKQTIFAFYQLLVGRVFRSMAAQRVPHEQEDFERNDAAGGCIAGCGGRMSLGAVSAQAGLDDELSVVDDSTG